VHGYEQWGPEELLSRIRGMYAFALWDTARRELFIARDRVGKKPLFVYDDGRTVLFSSDIKSIWLVKGTDLKIDLKAIDEYLFRYYISQDRSIFQGVAKLPPAGYAIYRMNAADTTRRTYWSLSYAHKQTRTKEEWVDGIQHRLREAVRLRLVADVPIGAFLSGGVDSSIVAALMAEVSSDQIATYTIGFDQNAPYDERKYARRVAEHIGSSHEEIILHPDVWRILPYLVWQYGEPFADASAVPTYFVSQAARRFATVVLTGDGGDEALAGYPLFHSADRSRRYAALPAWIRKFMVPAAVGLFSSLTPQSQFRDRALLFSHYLSGRLDQALRLSIGCWYGQYRNRLYAPELHSQLSGRHPSEYLVNALNRADGKTKLDQMLHVVVQCMLPSDYLTKVDVATMSVSLEARCPFLDTDLLEFAATIPPEMLLANGELKYLGKVFASRLVPPEVIYRDKAGFELPIGHWLRDDWHARLRRILLEGSARGRGLFNLSVVERIIEEHHRGIVDHKYRLWSLLILEIWHQMFVDRTLGPADELPSD